MTPSYIDALPQPLLDDLVAGKWLPVVGAGMSRNAIIPGGGMMPLWEDLGKELANELADYPYSGALDAISAYAHEFGRPRLVERLSTAVHVDTARPSDAHRASCAIPFDIVCTTNFDFLLERQYGATPRYCRPIIDEDHLAVNSRDPATALLKLHGDVHHPNRLIVTEEDYDSFLDRYPLLATYLANLLITRTAVLVGYSLDDPDFRQVWQIIGDRLGKTRRLAYALIVDARATDIARFARRGVKVVSLPGSRDRYREVLARTFDELREYLQRRIIRASQVTEEEPLQELSLPPESITRLCFFAIPLSLQPFYRDKVFPIASKYGLVPVTAADVIAPGDNVVAKIDALISRSAVVVVDACTSQTMAELRVAIVKENVRGLLVITEATAPISVPDLARIAVIERPPIPIPEESGFLGLVGSWLREQSRDLGPQLSEEPTRLLQKREYRSAVISAMTLLETALRDRVGADEFHPGRVYGLGALLDVAMRQERISRDHYKQLRDWMRIRNVAAHSEEPVAKGKATEIVNGVLQFIAQWRSVAVADA